MKQNNPKSSYKKIVNAIEPGIEVRRIRSKFVVRRFNTQDDKYEILARGSNPYTLWVKIFRIKFKNDERFRAAVKKSFPEIYRVCI